MKSCWLDEVFQLTNSLRSLERRDSKCIAFFTHWSAWKKCSMSGANTGYQNPSDLAGLPTRLSKVCHFSNAFFVRNERRTKYHVRGNNPWLSKQSTRFKVNMIYNFPGGFFPSILGPSARYRSSDAGWTCLVACGFALSY